MFLVTDCRKEVLTSPLCHQGVDIHEGCKQLERDLEPWLFPERLENSVFRLVTPNDFLD